MRITVQMAAAKSDLEAALTSAGLAHTDFYATLSRRLIGLRKSALMRRGNAPSVMRSGHRALQRSDSPRRLGPRVIRTTGPYAREPVTTVDAGAAAHLLDVSDDELQAAVLAGRVQSIRLAGRQRVASWQLGVLSRPDGGEIIRMILTSSEHRFDGLTLARIMTTPQPSLNDVHPHSIIAWLHHGKPLGQALDVMDSSR